MIMQNENNGHCLWGGKYPWLCLAREVVGGSSQDVAFFVAVGCGWGISRGTQLGAGSASSRNFDNPNPRRMILDRTFAGSIRLSSVSFTTCCIGGDDAQLRGQ